MFSVDKMEIKHNKNTNTQNNSALRKFSPASLTGDYRSHRVSEVNDHLIELK